MISKQKIAIVGSDGFVGNNLCSNRLLNSSYKIIKFNRVKFDLLNKNSLKKIKKNLRQNEIIIFTAGIVPVKNFLQLKKNLEMFFNFLGIINESKIKKFVYISSDAVYTDTKNYINEKSATTPLSLHGLMHYFRERLVTQFTKKLIIIRPTLIYGNNDTHNGYGPNKFIRLAKQNKNILLFGKGEEKRDHIHVSIISDFIYYALKRNAKGVFNLASGFVISFYSLSKHILKLSHAKSKIEYMPRNGPMHHLGLRRFDIKKIKKIYKFDENRLNIKRVITKEFINKFI